SRPRLCAHTSSCSLFCHGHAFVHLQPLVSPTFFFNDTPTTEIYTLSLHDALPISAGVKTPLAHVPGHVVGPICADAARGADGDRSPTGEIAGRDDPGAVVHAGGVIPVGHGGQRLAAELGERRSLVPADSCDRVILLAGRVLARFPGRRPVPARPVGHSSHGLLPRNDPTALHERLVPELAAPVATAVHEALELAVGDLEPIHQIVAQPDRFD